ncbi:MAG TPA: CBS domain-containing protein [Terriglobales bacterium]|nr:CBS domain-containing protein [Terriglobales bacterium]
MSPRAASRLESLGFREVYDYAAGKMDWFAAGLPIEGEAAGEVRIGQLAHRDTPSCALEDRLGEVSKRVESAGWDQAVVLDGRRVLLGWLGRDALHGDPSAEVATVMLEGPTTFRPNESPDETARWMDGKGVDSVLVTSSDGTFLGVLRRGDLDVPAPGRRTADA